MSEYKPNPIMHEQRDAILMSLSAIALMSAHPYDYWKACLEMSGEKSKLDESDKAMFRESAQRCEEALRRVCELLDAVMQYIGDWLNDGDSADEHGMTDAAFAAMARALAKPIHVEDTP